MTDPDNADHQLLATFLQDRDVHCPLCTYNLRSLKRSHCPECGKAIELTVKVPDLSYGSWIVMTFAMSLSAGIGLLFVAVVVKEGMPHGRSSDAGLPILGYFLTIPLAIWAITSRRRFLRLGQGSQHGLAVLSIFISIVLFVLLMSTLFH